MSNSHELYHRLVHAVHPLVSVSHIWVLDFIGHDPDLPLSIDNLQLVGLGLEWTHTPTGLDVHYVQGLVTEFSLFAVGFIIYWRAESNVSSKSAPATGGFLVTILTNVGWTPRQRVRWCACTPATGRRLNADKVR